MKYLDGKDAEFKNEDLQFLQEHFPDLWPRYQQEVNQVQGKSPKSQGWGVLRMARLYNSGVRFVYGCNGAEVPIFKWMEYLTDHDNIIKEAQSHNV